MPPFIYIPSEGNDQGHKILYSLLNENKNLITDAPDLYETELFIKIVI